MQVSFTFWILNLIIICKTIFANKVKITMHVIWVCSIFSVVWALCVIKYKRIIMSCQLDTTVALFEPPSFLFQNGCSCNSTTSTCVFVITSQCFLQEIASLGAYILFCFVFYGICFFYIGIVAQAFEIRGYWWSSFVIWVWNHPRYAFVMPPSLNMFSSAWPVNLLEHICYTVSFNWVWCWGNWR